MTDPASMTRARRVRLIAFVVAWALAAPAARAQDPPPPAPSSREAELEARLRRLESRYESMEKRHEAVVNELKALKAQSSKAPARGAGSAEAAGSSGTGGRPAAAAGGGAASGRAGRGAAGSNASDRSSRSDREAGGIGAQGTEGRTFVREYDIKPNKRPGKVTFSDGLEFGSTDDQFKLTFHNLTQVDYRAFPTSQHGTLQDQFVIPRQRWYFTGQVSRNFEFYTVVNRGYGSIDILDAFMTINLSEIFTNPSSGALTEEKDEGGDDGTAEGFGAQGSGGRTDADRGRGSDSRLRLRIGRMKTPYLYEYFSIAEGDLIAPERSLYAGNLADNRQIGAMFLGELMENRLGYATGVFSGNRRSFADTNSNLDLFFYVNSRPFLKNESLPFLNYLAFGGSANGGVEGGGLQPAIFTTANDQSAGTTSPTVSAVSPTFLAFNQNVRERGTRAQWSGDVAYFYKSLMLLAEYGGGFQGYTTTARSPYATRLPFDGYMVQAAYFLTGEELTRRVNVVRPLRSLGWYKGEFGLGAVEVHARYSELDLSPRIFTAGFADPNLWANRAQAVDIGLNWYWNYYTKFQLDWQHATYNQPISGGRDGRLLNATDLFWLRFQLFF